jgi:nitrate/TMAO reductase-like tetraheme cytochrome c subunit
MTPETSSTQMLATRRPVIAVFTSHWLAMVGLGLVLTAIVIWGFLVPAELRGGQENPYIGIAMFAAGGVLLAGLILAPIGLYLGRRRLKRRIVFSLQDGRLAWRRLFVFLLVVSLVNVVIASQMTLRAVHVMESKQFCGSCHVMTPEARAFPHGPHAGIRCVDCHVGDGARGFVKSKLQGTHQLLMVLRDDVPKPIKTAIESGRMVPSAETCEGCHWKSRPASAKLKMIRRYAEDEANTAATTLLTMNVGGAALGGIHGNHNGEGVEISFVAKDPRRQDIPLVEYKNTLTGETRTYVRDGEDAAVYADAPRIRMQCFDCHNRPAHRFQMADAAVDQAITLGQIPQSLPFAKKAAVDVLEQEYATSAAAADEIPAAFVALYKEKHPEVAGSRASDIQASGAVLADIYSRNVFPELGVTWGTYPDNLGHETYPGCFRCHGGEHVNAAAGETLTNECFRCHHPVAVEETESEALELLGIERLLLDLQKK